MPDTPVRANGLSRKTPLVRKPWAADRRATYVTEKAFQAMVEDLAGYLGWTTWHVNLPMRSPAGFPDLVLFRERIVFAELKVRRPRDGRAGKLSPFQITYAHTIQHAGGEYHSWLYPDDWEPVCEVLSRGGSVTVENVQAYAQALREGGR